MPRRREVPKRIILPDPKYGNEMLAKFVPRGTYDEIAPEDKTDFEFVEKAVLVNFAFEDKH